MASRTNASIRLKKRHIPVIEHWLRTLGFNMSTYPFDLTIFITRFSAKPKGKPVSGRNRGARWEWENEDNVRRKESAFSSVRMKDAMYIYKCDDSKYDINTKMKGIAIDSCHNSTFHIQKVLTSLEIINCHRSLFFITQSAPTVQFSLFPPKPKRTFYFLLRMHPPSRA